MLTVTSKLAILAQQQALDRKLRPKGPSKAGALDLKDGDTDLTALTKPKANQRQQKQSQDEASAQVGLVAGPRRVLRSD